MAHASHTCPGYTGFGFVWLHCPNDSIYFLMSRRRKKINHCVRRTKEQELNQSEANGKEWKGHPANFPALCWTFAMKPSHFSWVNASYVNKTSARRRSNSNIGMHNTSTFVSSWITQCLFLFVSARSRDSAGRIDIEYTIWRRYFLPVVNPVIRV